MFVAGFIGSPQMNFLDGTLIKNGDQYAVDLGGTVIPLPKEKTADGKLDAYVGKKMKMGIVPRTSRTTRSSWKASQQPHGYAEVEVSELMGAEIYLYLTYRART